MMRKHFSHSQWAVTLLELLAVVLILSILATIATGVYTKETERARIAATRDLIRQLEIAITRYEIDLGKFPPSGSGTDLPPTPLSTSSSNRENGSGYLHVALVHSMSGNALEPASSMWQGPYITFQARQIETSTEAGMNNILDPWGSAIMYVQNGDYGYSGSSFWGGTEMFSSATTPSGTNPDLPAPNPYATQGETYYNPSTYQIISLGPDGTTVNGDNTVAQQYAGTSADDVTNFGY